MARTFRMASAAAFLAALLSVGGAYAAPTTGSCSPTKVRYIASDAFGQVTSTTFVNVPESTVNIIQGGANPSCVIVSVSATPIGVTASPPTPAPFTLRVMMDGTTPALPNEVDISDGADTGNQIRSFDFIFPSVAPGTHSIRLQVKASPASTFNDFNRHNVIVQYAH